MIRAALLLFVMPAVFAQPSALPNRERAVRNAAKGVRQHLARQALLRPGRIVPLAPPTRATTVCASPLTPMPMGSPGQYAQNTVPLGPAIEMPAVVVPAPPCPVI